ncbi:nucleoporin 62 [Rhynchophorus ferrugineus]|uniref:Nucleoporin NSP1-like C-terminal domain-containing protein n=1 Tax=Rhynchophorus ferrugineus TaxID=354439 RepID=A0A834MIU5_RHYFE|nr:hypothetical protein GWI33_006604 [Rhynchophorus ferrugineus]
MFGVPAKTTAATGFSFSTPVAKTSATTTAPSLQFNFGAPITATAVSTAPSLQLSFGTSATPTVTTSTVSSFTPIIAPASTSSSTGLSFGLPTSTSAPTLGQVTTTTSLSTSKPSFSLGAVATTSVVSTVTTSTTPPISGTSITFAQLEDSINKWTIALEEQGKYFINQAKQLNAWDTLLISNGEKILNLNSSIERVKQQQSQLDQELDFILAQQKELEELIIPLEKDLVDIPVTDIDRNQMYQFAEIIDSQLKQISDDLKEIIENINESNKDEEISNPITQISKILNAHMNSLQWIDGSTAEISRQLEEISKIADANRRNLSLNNSLSMFQ